MSRPAGYLERQIASVGDRHQEPENRNLNLPVCPTSPFSAEHLGLEYVVLYPKMHRKSDRSEGIAAYITYSTLLIPFFVISKPHPKTVTQMEKWCDGR